MPEFATLPAVRPSIGLELAYRRKLEALIDEMHRSISYWLKAAYNVNAPEMASDASPAMALRKVMRQLAARWQKKFDEAAKEMAKYFALAAFKRSDAALAKILKKGGFSVKFSMTRTVNDVLQASIGEQVGLIKSIASEYLGDVEGLVMRAVQQGRASHELTQELRARYGLTRRRAALIARDQNNKATAIINRARQQEVGITEAVWVHSHGGAKPRPSHVKAGADKVRYKIADGWLDPATGKRIWPGTEINCRCVCRSVIPGVPRLAQDAAVQLAGIARLAASAERVLGDIARLARHAGQQPASALRLAQDKSSFMEEQHPRDADGKFAKIGNGVTHPKAGTTGAIIWKVAHQLSNEKNAHATQKEVAAKLAEMGYTFNKGTVESMHSVWKKFHGLNKKNDPLSAVKANPNWLDEPKPASPAVSSGAKLDAKLKELGFTENKSYKNSLVFESGNLQEQIQYMPNTGQWFHSNSEGDVIGKGNGMGSLDDYASTLDKTGATSKANSEADNFAALVKQDKDLNEIKDSLEEAGFVQTKKNGAAVILENQVEFSMINYNLETGKFKITNMLGEKEGTGKEDLLEQLGLEGKPAAKANPEYDQAIQDYGYELDSDATEEHGIMNYKANHEQLEYDAKTGEWWATDPAGEMTGKGTDLESLEKHLVGNKPDDDDEDAPALNEKPAALKPEQQAALQQPPQNLPKLSSWKKVGSKPGGSNPGAVYEDDKGVRWLVKGSNSGDATPRSQNEVLASKLMGLAGVGAPTMQTVDMGGEHGGGIGVASQMLEGFKTLNKNSSKELAAAQADFAVHAWLANWDSIGLSNDNTVVKDGKAYNIDPGGALLYRAQGKPKGSAFGDEVSELTSMRSPSKNPNAASVYGSMTNDQIKESAKKVLAISDKHIEDLCINHAPGTIHEKMDLAKKLIARKADLAKQVAALPSLGAQAAKSAPVGATNAPAASPPPSMPSATPHEYKSSVKTVAAQAGFKYKLESTVYNYFTKSDGSKLSINHEKKTWVVTKPDGGKIKGNGLLSLQKHLAVGGQTFSAASAAGMTAPQTTYVPPGEFAFSQHGAPLPHPLPAAQKSAMQAYTNGLYSDMNNILRKGHSGSPSLIQKVKNLLHSFALSPPVSKPFLTKRGITPSNLNSMLEAAGLSDVSQLKPGHIIEDKGVMSTSVNSPWNKGVYLHIDVPAGAKAIYVGTQGWQKMSDADYKKAKQGLHEYSAHPGEDETLLPPSKMRVKKVEAVGNKHHVHVEMLL